MTIPSTYFSDIDDAFVTQFAAQGVTLYPYESPALRKVPCATLVPETLESAETHQRLGYGSIEYKLRYYVALQKDSRLAFDDLKDGAVVVMNALGDPTLGGAIAGMSWRQARAVPIVEPGERGRRLLMWEYDVVVRPRPRRG